MAGTGHASNNCAGPDGDSVAELLQQARDVAECLINDYDDSDGSLDNMAVLADTGKDLADLVIRLYKATNPDAQ